MGWVQTKLSDSQQPTPSVPEVGKPKPNTNASSVVMVESSAIKEIFYSRDNSVYTLFCQLIYCDD